MFPLTIDNLWPQLTFSLEGLICQKLGLDKSKFDIVDFKVEDNAINNKQNGVHGAKPTKFYNKFLKLR